MTTKQSYHLTENTLLTNKHVLLCHNVNPKTPALQEEFEYLKTNFCGKVYSDIETFNPKKYLSDTIVYLCGNVKEIWENVSLDRYYSVNAIKELSWNQMVNGYFNSVHLGEVPINMHNVGVFFRKLFTSSKDYYDAITNEHEFQSLTLGKKPGTAFRKGIYLTNVKESGDEIKFKLLRCSTNLGGPTDNFRKTDNEVIDKVNYLSQYFFKDKVELNHVLAQTYHNSVDNNNKQKKAKIAEHSDKTKDMPKNALMAFCTFYKDYSNDNFTDENEYTRQGYDYVYGKGTTVLTKLRFRLKPEAAAINPELTKQFDITLYPNSVFLMSLKTNRLYTHEIIPSSLNVDKIPERMGYVIRCSNTNASFKDGQTFITKYGHYFPLVESTKEGLKELKDLYYKENTTIEKVDYEDKFYFSLNSGDYTRPLA